jgi:hypothetical protein
MLQFLLTQIGKLKSAISGQDSKIANITKANDLGRYTSLETFESDLLTFAQTLSTYEAKLIQFVFTVNTEEPFHSWSTFSGWIHCIQKTDDSLYFTCNIVSNNAEHVVIGYSNGTWKIKETTST